MIFRIIDRDELKKLFDLLVADNSIIAPVQTGSDCKGKPLYAFERVSNFDRIRLDYTSTKLPPKCLFLPYREDLASFKLDGNDWRKTIDYNIDHPVILFGLHACDINALNKLDKVLMGSVYPMPYYAAKRKNTFIIGIDCAPQPSCFCRSMGTDTAQHGFDMFITDLGGRFFVEVLSATAYNFIQLVRTSAPEECDHQQFMRSVEAKNSRFTARVDTTDLTKILDMEFQSPIWKHWGDKCLGCGTCANVCPTCYCYGVEESIGVDLKTARKTKVLYSCNIVDFAEVAGGHNFRPDRQSRIKYRFYHKHRGFVEAYEESLCVGCGRCSESCLAGITVPEVIAGVRGKEG
jgi:sulfhydrogenase subunit beta (sulfur reductase)